MYKYYNVSSIRMMRFLYSLGFEKESYYDVNKKERWRFVKSDALLEQASRYSLGSIILNTLRVVVIPANIIDKTAVSILLAHE